MTKPKKVILVAVAVFAVLSAFVISGIMTDPAKKLDDVDKILVMLAEGNPAYGRKSKSITEPGEIKAFLEVFNTATIGEKVPPEEAMVSGVSEYYLYNGEERLNSFLFNGNDSLRIFSNKKLYYVTYPDKTPYELYQASTAKEVILGAESTK